jgi:hypothetical protein
VRALRLLPPRRAHDQCHDPRAHRRRAPARQWPLAPAGVALLPRVSHRGSAGLGQAVYATGGARTPGWQAESQTGLLLTRVCASPWTDGLQTGMVSLLVKAAAFHAPCSQAPYKLQEKFGDMQVVGGDASRPAQPKPRLLLANFNQQTVGVCQRGLEPPGAGRQGGSGLLLMRLSLALDSRTSTRSCRGVRCNMTVSGRWSMLYMGLEFGVCEITCTLLGVI